MRHYGIVENEQFVGRADERALLKKISDQDQEARLVIVHGRRRVGKTELLEQQFRERHILKFEGIEGQPETRQQEHVMHELSHYAKDPLLSKVRITCWVEFFEVLYRYVKQGQWTIYFEEVQWLADYKPDFVAELKYAWDNYFRRNPKLIIILCGSSPSFMIEKVVKSRALYNRSQYEIPLKPFGLEETRLFLAKRSLAEVMDAYLLVGGVPEYLKRVNRASSVLLALAQESFVPGGFFATEYERIFTSSLAHNKHYQSIVDFLSHQHFATRAEILKHLHMRSGGELTRLLFDLEESGLIAAYSPFDRESSKVVRYHIADPYLQFYFKFIRPQQKAINNGDFKRNPLSALRADVLRVWMGFNFERFCRAQHRLIAERLGFAAVQYRAGAYFNREAQSSGYQIDLLFERQDKVYTICEIKYQQSKVSTRVIEEVEKKLERFVLKKQYSLHKVLITLHGAEPALINQHYFDDILTLEDFFDTVRQRERIT